MARIVTEEHPKAIFVDFDGLICDTERAGLMSWREMYGKLGQEFSDQVWARMCGRSEGEAVALADLAERLGRPVSPAEHAWRRRRKGELATAEPLRPGVRRLLDAAGVANVPVTVVSSSGRDWVMPHLSRLGVHDHLAEVVTGDETPCHKPAPDLYRLALRRVGVAAADGVAFEDSAVGVRAAVAAGLRCVAVPSSVGRPDQLGDADLVLDSLEQFDLKRSLPEWSET